MHPAANTSGDGTAPAEPGVDTLDLTCPSCETDLMADARFVSHRVCGSCGRHFSITARERIALLIDAGVFQELEEILETPAATLLRDQMPTAERLAEHQHLQVIGDAVVTGLGSIGGVYAIIVALDDHLVGQSLGALMSDKVMHAFDYARARKLPVVLLLAGGSASAPAGPLSLAQGSRLASAMAQLHLDGVPVLGIMAHPLSAGVCAVLAAHCDVLLSEPGVILHGGTGGPGPIADFHACNDLLEHGWIDAVVERERLGAQVALFVDLVTTIGMVRPLDGPVGLEAAPLLAHESLARLANPDRPGAGVYLDRLVAPAIEIRGDRITGDDPTVRCGIGRFESMTVAYAAFDRSGLRSPAVAARKVSRLAKLAGRLELPMLMLVDGDAVPVEASFAPETAFAEASLASVLSFLPVPVIAVGMGRISGSLATILINGDRQFLLASAVCAPTPEATGGWPPGRPPGARGGPAVLTASECERLGLIDAVIPEPFEGAHADLDGAVSALRSVLSQALAELTGTGQRRLLDTRLRRQQTLGQSTPEGLAAARSELWALQEWQRNVERSIDDWRERWDQLRTSQPRIVFQRPEMADFAARLRARRAELLERAGLGDRRSD